MENFSLLKLMPKLSQAFSFDGSAESLSSFIVVALWIMLAGFLICSLVNYIIAKKKLSFFKSLISGLQTKELSEKRRDILNDAMERDEKLGRLWREFDESLVHMPQRARLCNTFDASYFFNTHTIAQGLTENRLIAAVPGFLTAIGVIGTFIGLQLGLGSLAELNPEVANSEDLTRGIFGMIGGASIAFMTSVWGVATSVAYNFFEKFLERSIRRAIHEFQDQVDHLYPRITAEQTLAQIEGYSAQSNERLGELAEKIGDKMQEAMSGASLEIRKGLEESLSSILQPAVEKLVSNAQSGSEQALESLLERFMEGMGSAGDDQKAMMESASREVSAATHQMAEELGGFVGRLESQIEQMAEKNASVLNEVQKNINDQAQESQQRDLSRQKVLNAQLAKNSESQNQLGSTVEKIIETQNENHESIVSALRELYASFNQVAQSNTKSVTAMSSSTSELKTATTQLGLFSTSIKDASDGMNSNIALAVQTTTELANQNSQLKDSFSALGEKLSLIGDKIEQSSQSLDSAASKAESGLVAVERHFKDLMEVLESHIKQLDQEVGKMLANYATEVNAQTSDRMIQWSKQTSEYTGNMTEAINLLSSVVDEIDGKLSNR